ncbi:MAG TPA: hypothetical protein VFF21_03955 [Flavobacteriaceae bacterium]|nr:hypothetical protein [Flavobacteriaceae bacterium]
MRIIFTLIVSVFWFFPVVHATTDRNPSDLIVAVEGPLSLLWKKEKGHYHFYSKKDSEIIELVNSSVNGSFKEEYKEVLKKHSENLLPVDDVSLNLRSLINFYVRYNRRKTDPDFAEAKTEHRLGVFGGTDNATYSHNPTNAIHPTFGIVYELSEAGKRRRFSVVFRYTQVLEDAEHQYAASKFSFNYRLKFIRTNRVDFYLNTNIAEYNFSRFSEVFENEDIPDFKGKGSGLNTPFTFGIGLDYKIGRGYLGLAYNEIVSLNQKSNSEFPINLSLGYKIIL